MDEVLVKALYLRLVMSQVPAFHQRMWERLSLGKDPKLAWAILLGSLHEAEQIQHTAPFSLLPVSMHVHCLKDPACIWELKRKPWGAGGSFP